MGEAQVKVTAHFQREGSLLRGTLQGRCTGFDIELRLDADEDEDRIARLIRAAHNSCFTEDALERPVQVNRTHLVNGRPLEVTLSPPGPGAGE